MSTFHSVSTIFLALGNIHLSKNDLSQIFSYKFYSYTTSCIYYFFGEASVAHWQLGTKYLFLLEDARDRKYVWVLVSDRQLDFIFVLQLLFDINFINFPVSVFSILTKRSSLSPTSHCTNTFQEDTG